jgi:hypothetical protein
MADYKDMTPDSLRALARKIRYVAEGYEAVAAEVESRKLGTLSVPGINTAELAIRRLTGNMGSAQRALADAKAPAESLLDQFNRETADLNPADFEDPKPTKKKPTRKRKSG